MKATVIDLRRALAQRGWAAAAPASPTDATVVEEGWRLAALAGRLVEISAGPHPAALTAAAGLILEAQRADEPVAWIGHVASSFFAPDFVAWGIDLAALLVVRVPTPVLLLRAADRLLRSGAFGLVLLDLGARPDLPLPAQTRLLGLAKHHESALVCLTRKDPGDPSLGSLVSLRVAATREPLDPRDDGAPRYRCTLTALKDKRRGPGWQHTEICHAPPGLC